MTDEYYRDQVAVVTGADGTLCSELAAALAGKGAKVVLIGRTPEKLETVAAGIRSRGGVCRTGACDVTDEAGIKEIADGTLAEWGPCRFLLNGAGGNNKAITTNFTYQKDELLESKPRDMVGFFDLDMDVIGSVLKINIIGTVIPSRIFGAQMAKNGAGCIVNFASMNSCRPLTRVPAYAMSKAAIVNFTEWLLDDRAAAYVTGVTIPVDGGFQAHSGI